MEGRWTVALAVGVWLIRRARQARPGDDGNAWRSAAPHRRAGARLLGAAHGSALESRLLFRTSTLAGG